MILGIDEVGRGPWAGPLVVGALILGREIDGLTDSKKLTKKKREALYSEIMDHAKAVGIGWVQADELDKVGLSEALRLACKRAVMEVKSQNVAFHEVVIDGTVNLLAGTNLESHVTTMKKADLLVPSVSAASIVAKVSRDEYMARQDELYPGYGFAHHVGYGTAVHRKALETYGITPLHRQTFEPIATFAGKKIVPVSIKETKNTTAMGNMAEDVASTWLQAEGYTVIERNWKIKLCEIDIVAEKDGEVYFVEVKHRNNARSGDGLAAITPKKLRQMKFAANMYIHWHDAYQLPRKLAVISTSGEPPTLESFLEIE